MLLKLRNVSASVGSKLVVKNVSLDINYGEIHIPLGPNGAGKSSLLKAIMGFSNYRVVEGTILFENIDITNLKSFERAKLGIALAHQNPPKLRVRSRYFLSKLMEIHRVSSQDYVQKLD